MFKHLNSEQIEGFQKDGFLYPLDLFDEKQARNTVFSWKRLSRNVLINSMLKTTTLHIDSLQFLHEIAHCPVNLDVMEDLLGPDFLLRGTTLFIKHSHTRSHVSWQQDSTYTAPILRIASPSGYSTQWGLQCKRLDENGS